MPERRQANDRRGAKDRRGSRERRRQAENRSIVFELTATELIGAVLEKSPDQETEQVTTLRQPWRIESETLLSDQGHTELAVALKRVAVQHGLVGSRVRFVLGAGLSVTRVLMGPNETVRSELAEIEQRSQHYLTLGIGKKVLVSRTEKLDARHCYAVAAIANDASLSALYQASEQAGLKIESIESALTAIGRVVGHVSQDSTEPCLLIYLSDSAAEIGAYQGNRLLLEYRPGSCETTEELVQTIETHRNRLGRHIARVLSESQQQINRIYFIGSDTRVQEAIGAFAHVRDLEVSAITPDQIRATWQLMPGGETAGSAAIPVLGGVFGALQDDGSEVPNFMDHITAVTREPLRPVILKSLLPLAAVLLVAFGIWGISFRQASVNATQQAEVDKLAETLTTALELRLKRAANAAKLEQVEQLAAQVHMPNAAEVIENVARCMPNDVWLRTLSMNTAGSLTLQGSSFLEEGVFDFVKWLELAPGIKDVALRSTKKGQSENGLTVEFDVDVTFEEPELPTAEVASNE